jgi:hypothetical protein
VPLKDGPAKRGEGLAPGAASWSAIEDAIIEENAAETKASKKMVPKCEESSGTALRAALGTAGTAHVSVEVARVVGRPRRGAALLRRAEVADVGRGAQPCVRQKAAPAPSPAASLTPPVTVGRAIGASGAGGARASQIARRPLRGGASSTRAARGAQTESTQVNRAEGSKRWQIAPVLSSYRGEAGEGS